MNIKNPNKNFKLYLDNKLFILENNNNDVMNTVSNCFLSSKFLKYGNSIVKIVLLSDTSLNPLTNPFISLT